MIRFRFPDGAIESFAPEAREMLHRVCPHEVGHAVVAMHFGARVHGVALAQADGGVEAVAIYEIEQEMPRNDWCTIKAAGSAGEVIAFGSYGPAGAKTDLEDIRRKGCAGKFDDLVRQATSILLNRRARFERLTRLLCNRIFDSNDVISMMPLRLRKVGAYLLDEADFATHRK